MKRKHDILLGCLILLVIVVRWGAVAADRDGDADETVTEAPFHSVKRPAAAAFTSKDRAFFGAPPPVPHFWLTEDDNKSCLQCHAREFRIEKRHQPIRPVPHSEYSQCMQCHVRGNRPDVKPFVETGFVGLGLPGKGQRAHPLAPPTIPHPTLLRDNCLACHGPTGGYTEIRTTHPHRTQCRQCHVAEDAAR